MKRDFSFCAFGRQTIPSIIAVFGALAVGAVIIAALGANVITAYGALIKGAFGDGQALANTLQKATPYIFGGLAVMLAFRAGMFNIGVEGQMYVGALAAAWAGFTLVRLPCGIHLIVALAIGILAGGLWAYIPGVLKVYSGVNEVISTIMLNYIAYALTGYLTVHQFKEPGPMPQTIPVADTARLMLLAPPSKLNFGFLIALTVAVLVYLVIYHTAWGFDLRVTGVKPEAARYSGIQVKRVMLITLTVSGALGGLMGAERSLGVYNRFISSFSPGYGFTAIAVSLLGRNHPFGILLAAVLFGALEGGGAAMSLATQVPRELVLILQALIILFVAAESYIRKVMERRRVVRP